MMSVLTKTNAASSSCGCGCGGNCGGGCGGGALAAGGTFRRPAFFAGQLLTEEDLGALVDYVVGKNRLHNRFLFGDGVVCGLQLACDPCDAAAIRVTPGYALDCCGNDILVSCPETLDIKALLRDLRARQAAGYQCGDPCDAKDGRRSYGLYITYRETPADVVAPYASGDPCGQQQCQPTRIAEGYSFELRCDCEGTGRIDVFKRLLTCVGDLKDAAMIAGRAQTNQVIADKVDFSLRRMREDGSAGAFTAEDAKAIATAPRVMDELIAARAETTLPREAAFRAQVDAFQRATAAMARFRALSPEDQKAEAANHDISTALSAASEKLAPGATAVKELAPKVIFDPTIAALAQESATLAEKYAAGDTPAAAYADLDARMMMAGAPVTQKLAAQMRTDAGQIKRWLLERLEASCSMTTCTLYDRARAVRVSDPATEPDDEATRAATSRALRELTVIMIQYFVDCVCTALNPTCPDCTDTSVLLGCVEVEECKVTDLCNLSRRFVLAPTSMRYWLPPLGMFGDLIERLCCDFDASTLFRQKPVPEPEIRGRVAAAPGAVAPAVAEAPIMAASFAPVLRSGALDLPSMAVLHRLDLTAKDAETVTAFASNMAMLAVRSADVATETLRPAAAAIYAKVTDAIGGSRERPPATPAPVVDEAALAREREMANARLTEAIEQERAARADALKAATDASETTIQRALTRELSADRIGAAIDKLPLVKNLKAQNATLTKELATLKAAVAALKKGG